MFSGVEKGCIENKWVKLANQVFAQKLGITCKLLSKKKKIINDFVSRKSII